MHSKFISISGLKKSFTIKGHEPTYILKDIKLDIAKKDIYGIIGLSGAGKSTLLRCVNRLEEADEGQIMIDGTDIRSLSVKELNIMRQRIGMIFQDSNLFSSKNVFKNIEYPLKHAGIPKLERLERVNHLLSLVGLSDKAHNYPSQLSGGQRQRVGIARALTNNPHILLCDEATSSLDPQTTLSILDLLKDINKKMEITIIMVTHEVEVIKYACNHMAVIENGVIAESGSIKQIMNTPKSMTGNIFLKIEQQLKQEWDEKVNRYDI